MKPETEHRIVVLDGWRGLAITGVLIDHFFSAHFLNLGRFGVELFFVLSGRLMADILFVRKTPLKVFFPRRFSRIYPALFCFATIMFVVANTLHPFEITAPIYAASLFFTMNYAAIFWDVTPATDHLWSLSIEEHCYLLLGLLAAISRWRPGFPARGVIVTLIVLAVLNGIYQTYVWRLHYHNVYWRTDTRAASLLISVVFYLWLRERDPRPWLFAQRWTPVAFFAAGVALSINAVPDPIKYSLGSFCLAVGVATVTEAPAWAQRLLSSRVLTVLGVGSYSLYLWQQPFALIPDPCLRYASLILIAGVAWASYNGIEQPARKALNRLFAPRIHPDRVALASAGD